MKVCTFDGFKLLLENGKLLLLKLQDSLHFSNIPHLLRMTCGYFSMLDFQFIKLDLKAVSSFSFLNSLSLDLFDLRHTPIIPDSDLPLFILYVSYCKFTFLGHSLKLFELVLHK